MVAFSCKVFQTLHDCSLDGSLKIIDAFHGNAHSNGVMFWICQTLCDEQFSQSQETGRKEKKRQIYIFLFDVSHLSI